MQNALPSPEIERDKVVWRERRGWDVELARAVPCPRGLGAGRDKMTLDTNDSFLPSLTDI